MGGVDMSGVEMGGVKACGCSGCTITEGALMAARDAWRSEPAARLGSLVGVAKSSSNGCCRFCGTDGGGGITEERDDSGCDGMACDVPTCRAGNCGAATCSTVARSGVRCGRASWSGEETVGANVTVRDGVAGAVVQCDAGEGRDGSEATTSDGGDGEDRSGEDCSDEGADGEEGE
jgi:hypothetical protein